MNTAKWMVLIRNISGGREKKVNRIESIGIRDLMEYFNT